MKHTWFFKFWWERNVFIWFMVVWTVVVFFYVAFKPVEKLTDDDELNIKDLEANRI